MQEIIKWKVIPHNEPSVIRSCPKCGGKAYFENSKKFRVNANQNKLDIWLIYQCKKCKATWNMTILSRVSSKDIPKEQLKMFMENDEVLTRFYAFDIQTHKRNGSLLDYEDITYSIQGKEIDLQSLESKVDIMIECNEVFDIRVDKLVSLKLGLSREQVKKLAQRSLIKSSLDKQLWRLKLRNKMIVEILPNIIKDKK